MLPVLGQVFYVGVGGGLQDLNFIEEYLPEMEIVVEMMGLYGQKFVSFEYDLFSLVHLLTVDDIQLDVINELIVLKIFAGVY